MRSIIKILLFAVVSTSTTFADWFIPPFNDCFFLSSGGAGLVDTESLQYYSAGGLAYQAYQRSAYRNVPEKRTVAPSIIGEYTFIANINDPLTGELNVNEIKYVTSFMKGYDLSRFPDSPPPFFLSRFEINGYTGIVLRKDPISSGLLNVSNRSWIAPGRSCTTGFIVQSARPYEEGRLVLVRVIGSSLTSFGVNKTPKSFSFIVSSMEEENDPRCSASRKSGGVLSR